MRKRLKRTVAALVLVALTALSVILVISMSGDSVSAGMREGTIGFSDEGAEIQKESLSQPVLENSSAALYLSENGSVLGTLRNGFCIVHDLETFDGKCGLRDPAGKRILCFEKREMV